MKREKKIEQISREIQLLIDQLKEMNCSIDSSHSVIGVFDNTIIDEKLIYNNDNMIFIFNTTIKA